MDLNRFDRIVYCLYDGELQHKRWTPAPKNTLPENFCKRSQTESCLPEYCYKTYKFYAYHKQN